MAPWQGKWAVVTGASAGIGSAIARELAAVGTHLVLTARRRDRLDDLAARLHAAHSIHVEVCPADLAQPSAPAELFAFTSGKGIAVDLLVNNAGFGAHGAFREVPVQRQLQMVQVNISAVIHLTHLYLPAMLERRRGHILILASTAGFQAVPYLAAYSATKSFDLFFAEALAEEVREFGVSVTALCPGATSTEFQQVAGQPDSSFRSPESPDKVARVGLQALAAGKSMVISGARNRLMTQSQRLAPRRLVTSMAAKIFRPNR
ncbi:MAG TPA: SDR family oxidoreductase [Candidatus Acidoferrales bacterium]|nr:SDR family oxidoreductase [Candidatus Acidoferrales bacterium]